MDLGRRSSDEAVSYINKWPNFFIVGAAKAGTTSLHEYLKAVPGIYMSHYKEPHYFAPNVAPDIYYRKVYQKEDYLRLFEKVKDETAIGESSPSYLWDKESPRLIKNASPDAKIIIILRNPIDRAYSHYLHHNRAGVDTLGFYEALKRDYNRDNEIWKIPNLYVYQGLYYEQVKRFLGVFSKDSVKILIFEEFIKNPRDSFKEILRFLQVRAEVPRDVGKLYNPFYLPRNRLSPRIMKLLIVLANRNERSFAVTHILPNDYSQKIFSALLWKRSSKQKIPEKAFEFLREVYKDDVRRLESLLSRSLPWKF